MTHDDTPMWEDPQESSALRQLLRAGRVEHSDYDVERGLAQHLARLQAGGPLPAWAVQTTLQKSAGWSLLAWLLPPVISAGVVATWFATRPAEPAITVPAPTALAAAGIRPNVAPPPAPQGSSTKSTKSTTPAMQTAAAVASERADHVANVNQVAHAPQSEEEDKDEAGGVAVRERRERRNPAAARSARPPRAVSARHGRDGRDPRLGPGLDGQSGSVDSAERQTDVSGRRPGTSSNSASSNDSKAASASVGASQRATRADDTGQQSAAVPENPENQDPQNPGNPQSPAPKAAAREPMAMATAMNQQREKAQETAARDDAREVHEDEVTGVRLEREMRMLAVAQHVLQDDPARSLRLCRQGEREFSGSMFSAERKQVALLALVRLGRVDEARREGIPFLRAYPNAPWSARLREALATGRVPAP